MRFSNSTNSKEKLHFLEKLHFRYSDPNISNRNQLYASLNEDKDCYATHRTHGRKLHTPLWDRLKLDAKLQKQSSTEVPVHCRQILSALVNDLQQPELLFKSTQRFMINGSESANHYKNVIMKIVSVARHLNSNTDE